MICHWCGAQLVKIMNKWACSGCKKDMVECECPSIELLQEDYVE